MDRTDKQWAILQPLLPELPRRSDDRGRPWADSRTLLNGMLWVLRTGAQWQDLPNRYGAKSTCHRRFQQWVDTGVFEQILKRLAEDLKSAVVWTSVSALSMRPRLGEKRGLCVGPTRRGNGSKIIAVADRPGLPLAIHVESASPAEVQLVGPLLERCCTDVLPERLIGDKAYDSDG